MYTHIHVQETHTYVQKFTHLRDAHLRSTNTSLSNTYTILQYTATHCTTRCHSNVMFTNLRDAHLRPTWTSPSNAYNLLQYTATHCNTHCHPNVMFTKVRDARLRPTNTSPANTYNTLQYTATHRNTLQHTATHCNTLQHTAIHCNTLQHAATHCNTLQHSLHSYLMFTHLRDARLRPTNTSPSNKIHGLEQSHPYLMLTIATRELYNTLQHTATLTATPIQRSPTCDPQKPRLLQCSWVDSCVCPLECRKHNVRSLFVRHYSGMSAKWRWQCVLQFVAVYAVCSRARVARVSMG